MAKHEKPTREIRRGVRPARPSATGVGSVRAFLEDPSISEGQRSRLKLFESVERGICSRVEEMCSTAGIDVVDVAVLVVSADARSLLFDIDAPPGTSIVLGHRTKVYDLLRAALPSVEAGPDPYVDLLEPAPPRCVRVLILDRDSLTIMSYGTFVTVQLDGDLPSA